MEIRYMYNRNIEAPIKCIYLSEISSGDKKIDMVTYWE